MTPTRSTPERRYVDDKKAAATSVSNPGSAKVRGGVLERWRGRWQAYISSQRDTRWSVDFRLIVLTIINVLLYWPWHLLRVAFDAGDHHPNLALGLLLLTLWMWFELCTAILGRFKR
jgi:hypothetical protein